MSSGSAGNNVRILDDTVVNQIAAGEVVERPSSVVKELIENAIDAGATEISVLIRNGGRSSIEVVDNGRGMSRDNALLAIERFGTSKISTADDLLNISTLGFRGEALPSIASVSKFRMFTRENAAAEEAGASTASPGTSLKIQGGKLIDVQDADVAPGTRIEVASLFYNVPARKRFLRTKKTEAGMIKSLLTDFALAKPEIRFSLIVDDAKPIVYPTTGDLFQRVSAASLVSGKVITFDDELQSELGPVQIRGALSEPLAAVSSAARLRLIVNNRVVRDRLLLRAVREGYGNFLKAGKYPVGVLSFQLPATEVDVNVHPQKSEVRFRQPQYVFQLVQRAVANALNRQSASFSVPNPSAGSPATEKLSDVAFGRKMLGGFAAQSSPQISFYQPSSGYELEAAQQIGPVAEHAGRVSVGEGPAVSGEKPVPGANYQELRYLGQIFKLYLLFEAESSLAILDMHAAHERVMFYQIKKSYLEKSLSSQALLVPEVVPLPPDRIEGCEKAIPLLQRLGFEVEMFGESELVVRGAPAIFGAVSAKSMLDDLFSLSEWDSWAAHLEQHLDDVFARLACHGSVRRGRELEPKEAYQLLDSLSEAESSAYCPHGRPVLIHLDTNELERMFGRVV